MYKYLIAFVYFVGVISPAAADFYVDQDTTTKACKVVETKPDGTPPESDTTMMISDQTYKTKDAAELALKDIKECKK
jgi:hypothetical protein